MRMDACLNKPVRGVGGGCMEVCSKAEYASVIEREIARADRNGHSFSLIVFAFKTQRLAKNAWSFLQQLRARFRSYDEIGWLDDADIGILLPYLDAQQAAVLMDDVRADYGQNQLISRISLYTYPSNWIDSAAGHHGGSSAATDAAEQSIARCVRTMCSFNGKLDIVFQHVPVWKRRMEFFGAVTVLIVLALYFW